MKIGSLEEASLTGAKDMFLFDCWVTGLDSHILSVYRNVLASFISFTGDILVQELRADHVGMYIANLADGPGEGEEHDHVVMSHQAVVDLWVHWLYAQKQLTERVIGSVEPPQLTSLFPLLVSIRKLSYCC